MKFDLSIIIPTRDPEKLDISLNSINYSKCEVVIVYLPENTEQIVSTANKYLGNFDSLNFLKVEEFNNARNEGLIHSQGDWIMFLDEGNEILPESISTAFSHINNDNLEYVCCLSTNLDSNSDSLYSGKFYNREFLEFHDIRFDPESAYFELDFNMQVLSILYANEYVEDLCYHYYPEKCVIVNNNPSYETQEIEGITYGFEELHFCEYMDAYFSRLTDLAILLSKEQMNDRLNRMLPYVLDSFVMGYFQYQLMLYHTQYHPLADNLWCLYKAKKLLNIMGFTDEDIITAAIVNPERYYELKRRMYSQRNFIELESFYSFINNLNDFNMEDSLMEISQNKERVDVL